MISMTYGRLPTLEQYEEACAIQDDRGSSVNEHGFRFGNDPRIGDDCLTSSELWAEIQRAHGEWEAGDEAAGDWLSCVLGVLGFEWI